MLTGLSIRTLRCGGNKQIWNRIYCQTEWISIHYLPGTTSKLKNHGNHEWPWTSVSLCASLHRPILHNQHNSTMTFPKGVGIIYAVVGCWRGVSTVVKAMAKAVAIRQHSRKFTTATTFQLPPGPSVSTRITSEPFMLFAKSGHNEWPSDKSELWICLPGYP